MHKRIILVILAACVLLSMVACAGKDKTDTAPSSDVIVHTPSNLIGFAVQDTGDMKVYEAMHSFICTAADIGMNAKLYKFASQQELDSAVDDAITDNCDAVLFYCENTAPESGMEKLEKHGIRTVSLIQKNEKASCSIIADDGDSQMLAILAEKAVDGSVLIYSSEAVDVSALSSILGEKWASTPIKSFVRTEYAYNEAKDSLYSYLVNNTSVKAIYALGEQNARPATLAAQKMDSGIVVIGCELTDINVKLYDEGLYALAVTPYYDMAARAVYAMQKLADGKTCEDEVCSVHLVTADKLEKYNSIRHNTAEWFGIQG